MESKLIRISLDTIRNVDDMGNILKDHQIPYKPDEIFNLKKKYHDIWIDPISHDIMMYRLREKSILNPSGIFSAESYEKIIMSISPLKPKRGRQKVNLEKMSPEEIEKKLNEILDKINNTGRKSLDDYEQGFLKEYTTKSK